ncbi:hypothetical protein ACU686_44805 [Yinghuangia aomiensis]
MRGVLADDPARPAARTCCAVRVAEEWLPWQAGGHPGVGVLQHVCQVEQAETARRMAAGMLRAGGVGGYADLVDDFA